MLIEEVCGDTSIHELSLMFGRTPSSIKTRVSTLVGLERISQEVAGRFIGKINGDDANADIEGIVLKKGDKKWHR